MTVMKKKYIKPSTLTVGLRVNCAMLAVSNTMDKHNVSVTDESDVLSRRSGSLWDDDDEE